jgi:hypothetical protein
MENESVRQSIYVCFVSLLEHENYVHLSDSRNWLLRKLKRMNGGS